MKYLVKWKTNDFYGLWGYYVADHNWTKYKEKAKRFFKIGALLKVRQLKKQNSFDDEYFIVKESEI